MGTIVKRMIVLLAAVMLAGASVGCQKRANQGTQGEQQQGQGPQQGAGAQQGGQPTVQNQQQAGPPAQGQNAQGQQQTMDTTRSDVADQLGIPTSAVIFSPKVQQDIVAARDNFERTAWGTVGTIDSYLNQINVDNLNSTEKKAYKNLRTQVSSAQKNLQQLGQQGQSQYNQTKKQVDQSLAKARKNWNQLVNKIKFNQPTGGGPETSGPQAPDGQPNTPVQSPGQNQGGADQ